MKRSSRWLAIGGWVGRAATAGLVTIVCALAPRPAAGALPPDVLIYPTARCAEDTVVVFVRGYASTPCDSFVSAEKVDERTVRVRNQVYTDRYCFAAPFQFFSVPVVMGRFPAGHAEITLLRETIRVAADGSRETRLATETLAFDVAATCQAPEPIPAEKLPYVLQVTTVPSPPCPDRGVAIHVAGVFRDGCGRVVSVDPSNLSIVIAPYPPTPMPCTLALKPWSADLPLGLLEAGHHEVVIRLTVLGCDTAWPPLPTQTYLGVFRFDVALDCAPGLLPYVDFIRVQPKRLCGTTSPICPGDSIQVVLGGTFPNSCYRVESLELIDLGYATPIPMPPLVRLRVRDNGCTRVACSDGPVPWSASATFGPLLSGGYLLMVDEIRTLGCPAASDTHATVVPLAVAPAGECDPVACQCLGAWWASSGPGPCNAFIAPGEPASLTLKVASPVALAGLEGTLHAGGGLRITGLGAVGAAAGMHLSWSAISDGVKFVMFAEQGAPIPPSSPLEGVPVLAVTVELVPTIVEPRLMVSTGWDLLGSDADARAVPMCLPGPRELRLPPTAVLCLGSAECDFNGDGHTDVCDLVGMVRCLMQPSLCTVEPARVDCDGDGSFELDDVLCCAQEVLSGPGCPDCPTRPEPAVGVEFGDPIPTTAGIDVPIHVAGLYQVGAAKIRLEFPAERFDVAGVDALGMHLHQVQGSDVVVGLIGPFPVPLHDLAPGQSLPPEITLHLALRPGQVAGGEVRVAGGDFSGPDGVKLDVSLGQPRLELVPVPRFGVSSARPNPFSSETRFSVMMPSAGALDVGVFDLAGRRVATVFRGQMGPGVHPFTWDGKDSDGRRASGGVYFCRVVTGGNSVVGRMVLLTPR